jgi:hypothetical protein
MFDVYVVFGCFCIDLKNIKAFTVAISSELFVAEIFVFTIKSS